MTFESEEGMSPSSPESDKNPAYLHAVRLLARKDYSEYKIRSKLREKKFSQDEIDEAVTEIIEKGYLREDYYAEARIKGLMYKGYPPSWIIQKLAQEKVFVDEENIKKIFEEYGTSHHSQIKELALKKLRSIRENDPKKREKVLRFLLSKGHGYSDCCSVTEELISSQEPS